MTPDLSTETPTDLFDAVCRLDDLADYLNEDYPDAAQSLRGIAAVLKDDIAISLPASSQCEHENIRGQCSWCDLLLDEPDIEEAED